MFPTSGALMPPSLREVQTASAVACELRAWRAPAPGDAFKLRCEIREKLIDFLQRDVESSREKARDDRPQRTAAR
jgi:hypothetical protein